MAAPATENRLSFFSIFFFFFYRNTILMFRVAGFYIGTVGNRNHTYISFRPKVEMVQRRAASFTTNRYRNTSNVSSMLDHIQWESLEARRNMCVFTKCVKCLNDPERDVTYHCLRERICSRPPFHAVYHSIFHTILCSIPCFSNRRPRLS